MLTPRGLPQKADIQCVACNQELICHTDLWRRRSESWAQIREGGQGDMSDVVDLFFFFFACQKGLWCTLGTPTLCLENWAKHVESEKKKCPSPISFFGTCATLEAGGGPKKPSVSPPPPPHDPLRICATDQSGQLTTGIRMGRRWYIHFENVSWILQQLDLACQKQRGGGGGGTFPLKWIGKKSFEDANWAQKAVKGHLILWPVQVVLE